MRTCGAAVLSQDVRLSVRLSHAGVVSKRLNISSNCVTVGKSHILFLFFYSRRYGNVPTKTASPNGGIEWKMYEKIAIFDQYLALSRKWYKIWSRLLWNVTKNYAIYRMVLSPVTLSDLEMLWLCARQIYYLLTYLLTLLSAIFSDTKDCATSLR